MKANASYHVKRIRTLSDEVKLLQSRAQQLQEEHTTLQVQQHVLASVCDALNWLRGGHAQAAVHQHWLASGATAGGPSQEELELLHQLGMMTDSPLVLQLQQLQQVHLLQHSNSSSEVTKSSHRTHTDLQTANITHAAVPQPMQQSPTVSAQFDSSILSPRAAVAAGCSPPAPACLAADPPDSGADASAMQPMYLTDPAGNYLGMLWYALSRAPDPRAGSMTMQQFAQYWAGLVRELSLCLALTERQGPQYAMQQDSCAGLQRPLLALQDHLQQHMCLCTAVVLQNRGDLLYPLRLINLDTLELSDTPEQSWERLFWLTEQLQLREEQRLAITAGCEVFKRLLDRVIEARQALLKQQAAQAGVRLPTGRSADLETEQQMVKQLQRLERQEQFLVIFATLFVVCVLDVVQLARATVLVWPFVPHFHLLGTAMMKRKAAAAATAQQQGQQQQRQQPVQNRCRSG